jgi:sugar diacid utilization regulator
LPVRGKVADQVRHIEEDGQVPRRRHSDSEGGVRLAPPDDVARVFRDVADRVARDKQPVTPAELGDMRSAGAKAAEHGMTASEAVDLYLETAARAWSSPEGSPQAHGHALISAIRAAVPVLIEGYQNAGQGLVRQEEAIRVELIDDLLRGDADVASMVQRAEPFGLDLSASHQVVLAAPRGGEQVDQRDRSLFDRAVKNRYGDRHVLVTHKPNHLVALIPWLVPETDIDEAARQLHADLRRSDPRRHWRFAVGRPHSGAYGVARSYQQAREAMQLAKRLHPDDDMVPTRNLLIYRVLGRDRAALTDLVENVLTPLTQARGGAGPLVDTLEAYFAAGEVATVAARRLHVSVRTVTYRLAKISHLTGYDLAVPTQRLTLQAAVIGARLLPWPDVRTSAPQ